MGGRVCGQAQGLAAIHRREEPDALMSARPGPSGGYPVRGIPTGSDNHLGIQQVELLRTRFGAHPDGTVEHVPYDLFNRRTALALA
jgi:hypothetical protein